MSENNYKKPIPNQNDKNCKNVKTQESLQTILSKPKNFRISTADQDKRVVTTIESKTKINPRKERLSIRSQYAKSRSSEYKNQARFDIDLLSKKYRQLPNYQPKNSVINEILRENNFDDIISSVGKKYKISKKFQDDIMRRRSMRKKIKKSNLDTYIDKHLSNILNSTISKHENLDLIKQKKEKLGWDMKSMCYQKYKAQAKDGSPESRLGNKPANRARHNLHIGMSYYAGKTVNPLERFKSAARKITFLARVCLTFRLYVVEAHGHMTFHQMGNDNPIRKNDNANYNRRAENFELADFKSHSEFKFPKRGRRICETKPECRTIEQIEALRRLMLTMESFRGYTPNIQLLLCKRLRFEKYERRRLIIRRGHVATSLYFIFSGSIGVADDYDGTGVFTQAEPIVLRKGTCFGELGLINQTRRTRSIVCMESTELLVIDRDDFTALNLFDLYKKEYDERYSFFRHNPLLKDVPDENIAKISNICRSQWYIHNQVIIKDSTKTNTVTFVKSGRLGILRLLQLDGCTAFKQQLLESGSFPEIHCLKKTLRQSPKVTANQCIENIQNLNVPDLNFSTYLEVDQLQAGQVFGLNHYVYPDDRIFTLISGGCELLRVPMTFMIEMLGKANIEEKIKKFYNPCPSDEELSKLFMAMNHWRFYKNVTVENLVSNMSSNRQRANSEEHLIRRTNYGTNLSKSNLTEIGDWFSGCIQMPKRIPLHKPLQKFMVVCDATDSYGGFSQYKLVKLKSSKMYNKNFEEELHKQKIDEANVNSRKLSLSTLENLKIIEDLDSYDPAARAKILRKQVENTKRDILSKLERIDNNLDLVNKQNKKKNEPSAENAKITRLIQGIELPTFRLNSFG